MENIRLDKFLSKQRPEFSRSRIIKLIKAGKVKVNGKLVAPHYFLKEKDKIEADLEKPPEIIVKASAGAQFKVVHEENNFLVIDKPAGLVVHQGEGHKKPDTLVNGLLARYKDCPSAEGQSFSRVGDDPIRPGIVHRLDADASGIMVIAKTQDMYDHLKKQFMAHEVEKEYVAIVQGKVSPPQGVIDFPIDRKGAKMVARAKGQEGKMAVTEYEAIEHDNMVAWEHKNITLLKIITRTGRTHQIRVHLMAKGWPIVGDRLYCSKLSKLSEISKSSRLMLHARKLTFKDLQGERREFVVEIPDDFKLTYLA